MRNYLTNRTWGVKTKDVTSSPKNFDCGVPRSTILGPLMLMIYINGILTLCENAEIFSYADNIIIICTAESWSEVELLMTGNLSWIRKWLCSNELSHNISKTKYKTFVNFKDKLSNDLNILIQKNDLTYVSRWKSQMARAYYICNYENQIS